MLLWTQIGSDGQSSITGVAIDPSCRGDCVSTTSPDRVTYSHPSNLTALTYSYHNQTLYAFNKASKKIVKNTLGSSRFEDVFDLSSSQVL